MSLVLGQVNSGIRFTQILNPSKRLIPTAVAMSSSSTAATSSSSYLSSDCAICGANAASVAHQFIKLSFKVNTDATCGHKFCNKCLDNELQKKIKFTCPLCKNVVMKNKLSDKSVSISFIFNQ